MKPTVPFLLILCLLFTGVKAQTYNLGTVTGTTINTCSGVFVDGGGAASNYGNNLNQTVTFCSNSAVNTQAKLYFDMFSIDYSDTLWIHDGPNTAAPLIVSGNAYQNYFNNNNSLNLFPVQSTTSGCLTVRFKSNAATAAAGWSATVSCANVCQVVVASIDSLLTSPAPNDSDYIDVCYGDSVTFVAKGIYPQSGLVYGQSDATSKFYWDLGDGIIDSGKTVTHLYTLARGYDVQLTIVDSNGCKSYNAIQLRVRVSKNPIKGISIPSAICANESYHLRAFYNWPPANVNLEPQIFTQNASQRFDSTMFIPDGPNCPTQCYNTFVTFNSFLPGQTITSANDILSICVNMEHSFVGDLQFTIKCPSNQQAILKTYINSGGAWMGAALDGPPWDNSTFPCDPTMNQAGTGWNYCWSQTYPNIGTVNSHSGQSQLDSTNTILNTGYYQPDQTFANLVGCPLNGTWTIEICDYWAIDNGYIFSWDLNLQPNLLPTNWSYQVKVDTMYWSGPYIDSVTSTSAYISPDIGGIYNYTFTYVDEFGCSYDTIVPVNVINNPIVDLGNDTTICGSDTLTLAIAPGATGTYSWSPGGQSTSSIKVNTGGTYSVTVTNVSGALTCTNSDDIVVGIYPAPAISFNPDITEGCEPLSVTFSDLSFPAMSTYNWQFGDGGSSTQKDPVHVYNVAGIYDITLSVVTTDGCPGEIVIPQLITVHATPDAAFTANPMITNINTTISFTNLTVNGQNYYWDFGDGQNSSLQNPTHAYGLVGDYTIWLYATTPFGCRDSVSLTLKVINDELEIPNIFTPNGDGSNDRFEIKHLMDGGYPSRYLAVYNRWGRKVFESNNYQNEWDGEGASDGVYYYVLICKGLVQDFEANGTVTIMR
jgi:gliding motility-associated-like protein